MAYCPGCNGVFDGGERYVGLALSCGGREVVIQAGKPPMTIKVGPTVYGTFPVGDISKPDDRFPHKCPTCGEAAYINGMNQVEHRGLPCRR